MRPVNDRVILELPPREEKIGSIYLPDSQRDPVDVGVVVAVGTKKNGDPLEINVGEKVKFDKHAGSLFEYNSKTYKVLRYDSLKYIVDDDDDSE